jgi:hypothetical protein
MTIVDLGIYIQMIFKKKISINGKNKKMTMISKHKKERREERKKLVTKMTTAAATRIQKTTK